MSENKIVEETIYLTEMSIKELLEGKTILEDDGRVLLIPPKTNELGLKDGKTHYYLIGYIEGVLDSDMDDYQKIDYIRTKTDDLKEVK